MKKIFICIFWSLIIINITNGIDLSGCYKKEFKVSAYYSPVRGQKFYYKGNYFAEVKLNGKGVKGASGKYVFNGMIAAPASYKFGTKIYFPALNGVGQVEDRGGAIVHKGEKGQVYDRIDIWVGTGELGLMRALSFGKKVLVGYVCPSSKTLKIGFDYTNFKIFPDFFQKTLWGVGLFVGRKDGWVTTLQVYLKKLGFFNYKVTGYFGAITKQAVSNFQKKYGITTKWLGYFGPKTRYKLKQVLKEKGLLENVSSKKLDKDYKKSINDSILVADPSLEVNNKKIIAELSLLTRGLGKGYNTYEVKILQKYLKQLGYYTGTVNGFYGNTTVKSVAKFQIDNNIITTYDSYAAGWFGPKTRKVFKKVVLDKLSN